jgi:hypothetical protein
MLKYLFLVLLFFKLFCNQTIFAKVSYYELLIRDNFINIHIEEVRNKLEKKIEKIENAVEDSQVVFAFSKKTTSKYNLDLDQEDRQLLLSNIIEDIKTIDLYRDSLRVQKIRSSAIVKQIKSSIPPDDYLYFTNDIEDKFNCLFFQRIQLMQDFFNTKHKELSEKKIIIESELEATVVSRATRVAPKGTSFFSRVWRMGFSSGRISPGLGGE